MRIKIEFDLIKNTVKTHKQVKYYYNLKELFSIWIYFKMFVFFLWWQSWIIPGFSITWSIKNILICWFVYHLLSIIIDTINNSGSYY